MSCSGTPPQHVDRFNWPQIVFAFTVCTKRLFWKFVCSAWDDFRSHGRMNVGLLLRSSLLLVGPHAPLLGPISTRPLIHPPTSLPNRARS